MSFVHSSSIILLYCKILSVQTVLDFGWAWLEIKEETLNNQNGWLFEKFNDTCTNSIKNYNDSANFLQFQKFPELKFDLFADFPPLKNASYDLDKIQTSNCSFLQIPNIDPILTSNPIISTLEPDWCLSKDLCCGKNAHCEGKGSQANCVCNNGFKGVPYCSQISGGGCYILRDTISLDGEIGVNTHGSKKFIKEKLGKSLEDVLLTNPAYIKGSLEVKDFTYVSIIILRF